MNTVTLTVPATTPPISPSPLQATAKIACDGQDAFEATVFTASATDPLLTRYLDSFGLCVGEQLNLWRSDRRYLATYKLEPSTTMALEAVNPAR